MKVNKIIPAIIIGCLSSSGVMAQELNLDPGGTVQGNVKVKTKVPQLCEIQSGTFFDFNFGEYIGESITKQESLYLNCKSTAKINFSIDLGSNPNSTPESRRMPLAGALGDVNHYMKYSIKTSSSATGKFVATGEHSVDITRSSGSYLSLYAILEKTQETAIIGEYSDTLDATLEYN